MPTGLPPIAIIVSRYNGAITSKLLAGAVRAYTQSGGLKADLTILDAAGTFELPFLAAHMLYRHPIRARGVVAIGCIVKGETSHDAVLGHAVTSALANLSAAEHPAPVGLAVLTVDTVAQARARAGGRLGNKGAEAMLAVLQSLAAIARIDQSPFCDKHAALRRLARPARTAPDKSRRGKRNARGGR